MTSLSLGWPAGRPEFNYIEVDGDRYKVIGGSSMWYGLDLIMDCTVSEGWRDLIGKYQDSVNKGDLIYIKFFCGNQIMGAQCRITVLEDGIAKFSVESKFDVSEDTA